MITYSCLLRCMYENLLKYSNKIHNIMCECQNVEQINITTIIIKIEGEKLQLSACQLIKTKYF